MGACLQPFPSKLFYKFPSMGQQRSSFVPPNSVIFAEKAWKTFLRMVEYSFLQKLKCAGPSVCLPVSREANTCWCIFSSRICISNKVLVYFFMHFCYFNFYYDKIKKRL